MALRAGNVANQLPGCFYRLFLNRRDVGPGNLQELAKHRNLCRTLRH